MDLLFECAAERLDGVLRAGNAKGPVLQVHPLPYPLVDVTA
jgi:hypothetical protein